MFLNLINDSECNYLRLLITIQLKKKTPETELTSIKFPEIQKFLEISHPCQLIKQEFQTQFDIL